MNNKQSRSKNERKKMICDDYAYENCKIIIKQKPVLQAFLFYEFFNDYADNILFSKLWDGLLAHAMRLSFDQVLSCCANW